VRALFVETVRLRVFDILQEDQNGMRRRRSEGERERERERRRNNQQQQNKETPNAKQSEVCIMYQRTPKRCSWKIQNATQKSCGDWLSRRLPRNLWQKTARIAYKPTRPPPLHHRRRGMDKMPSASRRHRVDPVAADTHSSTKRRLLRQAR
jgi:hypothetical protein